MPAQMKVWAYLLAILAAMAASGLAYYKGGQRMEAHLAAQHQLQLAQLDMQHKATLVAALKEARRQEQDDAAKAAAIDKNLIEGLRNENRKKNDLIADLRAGNIKLRQRFTSSAAGTCGGVPTATEAASSSDATQAGGLLNQDAEFLIQLAAEADEVVLQLQACQALIQ